MFGSLSGVANLFWIYLFQQLLYIIFTGPALVSSQLVFRLSSTIDGFFGIMKSYRAKIMMNLRNIFVTKWLRNGHCTIAAPFWGPRFFCFYNVLGLAQHVFFSFPEGGRKESFTSFPGGDTVDALPPATGVGFD